MESRIPPLTPSQSSILQPGTSAPDFTLNATPESITFTKELSW